MATVNVVKGSADEAILRKQYGDTVNYNYSDKNQFAGADRFATNKMYQEALGKPVNDAGDLWGYSGVAVDNNAKPAAPQYNPLDQMEQLKQAQLQASMAGLDKQRNNSLSNLSAERAVIEPQYQKQKIAANVTAKQTARSFDEYMAQRGSSNSGIAGQGTLLNNLGYQGQVGSLNEAEAGAISDNARRVTGVQNNFESDRVAAEANIQSQYLQNYIQQMNTDKQMQMQQDQFSQNMGLQQSQFDYGKTRDTVQDTRYGDETQYNRSQAEMEWEFKQQGYSDEQAYRMSTLAIQQQNANSRGSGSNGKVPAGTKGVNGGSYSDSATNSMLNQLKGALADGATVADMMEDLDVFEQDGTAELRNYDTEYLRNWVVGQRQSISDLRRSQGGGI